MSENKGFKALLMSNGDIIQVNKALKENSKQFPDSNQLDSDDFFTLYDTSKVAKPPYNPEHLAIFLETNTYHYRCVKQKSADVVGLGWDLEEVDESDDDKTKNPNYKKIKDFFDTCHPTMTFDEIMDQAWTDFESIGWLCIEVIRTKGGDKLPARFEHLPAKTVRVSVDPSMPGIIQKRGNKERYFKYFMDEEDRIDKNTNAPTSEVIFMINYHPKSDYYGIPDYIPAIGAMVASLEIRDYNIEFFDNNAIPDYAIVCEGGEPDESFEKTIKDYFLNNLKGKGKHHRTLVVSAPEGGKIHFQPLSVDIKDGHFRLYRMDCRDEVIHAHGVPPYRIGIAETGSMGGSTAQESNKIYKSSVAAPRQEKIENRLTRFIRHGLKIEGWKFKFNELDLTDKKLDADIEKTKADTAKILVEAGLNTPDEARYNVLEIEKYSDNKDIEDDVKEWANRPITVPKPGAMNPDGTPVDPSFQSDFEKQFASDMKSQGLNNVTKIMKHLPKEEKASLFERWVEIFKKKGGKKPDFFKEQDRVYGKMKKSLGSFFDEMRDNVIKLIPSLDLSIFSVTEVTKALSIEEADQIIALYPELYLELASVMSDIEFATLLFVLMQEGVVIGKVTAADDLGKFSELVDWTLYDKKTSAFLDKYVFKASQSTMNRLIGDVIGEIKKSQEAGESIPQIQEKLNTVFNDMRDFETERVARTETNKSSNWARFQAFRDSGKPYKKWKTNIDGRERESHKRIAGEIKPMEDKFSNGLYYPGDPLSDKVSEIVNCRCTIMWADFEDGTMDLEA